MAELYSPITSSISGKLTKRNKLGFRSILTRRDRVILGLFSLFLTASTLVVLSLLFTSLAIHFSIAALVLVLMIGAVELIRFIQSLTLIIFASKAKDPIPMEPGKGLRVAVLTTIVPGKEPLDLVAKTLEAMKQMDPGDENRMDVWLLDEGNDPEVKKRCYELGVYHFSRKGIAKWNMQKGAHKAKTKHGNHNAWRSGYEGAYDVVAQMDPDHIPRKDFLTRTLGYFKDDGVSFVVAPQVYGNGKDSWIAAASAFQAYVFHGIIQRGANGLNAPLLIGTNHLYRVSAFKQINGYQDSIIEDHLTSMVIYSSKDKDGVPLKGVYTPDILAVGEGPTSYTDYFNQQKRWAYGIWEIMLKSTPTMLRKMKLRQSLSFLMLQFFYPSVAVAWVFSSITALVLCFYPVYLGEATNTLFVAWVVSLASGFGLFFWLRKFNLVEHERKDWGLKGMALLLMCVPIYVNAALQALARRPLTYEVTAKGSLTSPDTLMTFASHINWAAFNVLILTALIMLGTSPDLSNTAWTIERLAVCLSPLVLFGIGLGLNKRAKRRQALADTQAVMMPITLAQKRAVSIFAGE